MKKVLNGKIVSTKMQRTAVVEVEIWKVHPLYGKRYRQKSRYLADNPEDQYQMGEKVQIEETAPMSKLKRWRIIKAVANIQEDLPKPKSKRTKK